MDRLTIKKPTDSSTEIPEDLLVTIKEDTDIYAKIPYENGMSHLLTTRASGEFKYKAFFLNSNVNWKLGIDSLGQTILVPIKKV